MDSIVKASSLLNDRAPNEILYLIFQFYFTLNSESMNATRVCKRWNSLFFQLVKQYESHTIEYNSYFHPQDYHIMKHFCVKRCTFIYFNHYWTTFVTCPTTEEINFIIGYSTQLTTVVDFVSRWFPNAKVVRFFDVEFTTNYKQVNPSYSIEMYWCKNAVHYNKTKLDKSSYKDSDLAHDITLILNTMDSKGNICECITFIKALCNIPEPTESFKSIVSMIDMEKDGKMVAELAVRLIQERFYRHLRVSK
jgi:hypothetical protein